MIKRYGNMLITGLVSWRASRLTIIVGSIVSLSPTALGTFLMGERNEETAKFACLRIWCENEHTAHNMYATELGTGKIGNIVRFI
jgi:hypothetical protein